MDTPLRLKLAFRRVRDEITSQPTSGRALVPNAFELELIEVDYQGWIDQLREQLDGGQYTPGPLEICPAPKAGSMVRPGSRLGIPDRVVYTAAVGACLRQIESSTRWSQRTIDFATWLDRAELSKKDWLVSPFASWDAWRKKSLERLAQARTKYVLTADIAGYFENINLAGLASDLSRVECPDDVIKLIGRCLNQWAQSEGRGLPQGVLASDVLAKIYLESFDRALKTAGYRHLRYTDDIRVFCRSEREAKRALVLVTELLRGRGLTLQSAKTQIRPAEGLEAEFDGAFPFIQDLNRSYIKRAQDAGIMAADPSLPVSVIDDLIVAESEQRQPGRYSPSIPQACSRCVEAQPLRPPLRATKNG